MPAKPYFLKMGGFVLLGGATLLMAVLIVLALSPFIIPFVAAALPFIIGVWVAVTAVIMVWAALFAMGLLGAFIYYFFKSPMKVNKNSSGYKMNAKESGRRKKGKS